MHATNSLASPFHFFLLSTLACLPTTQTASAETMRTEEGDAALSSDAPHIPEPMVFDLVRPLGVRQGDAEVNVLTEHSLRNGDTEWAPEFEFGLFDDFAIEFELPFDNLRLGEYKLGLQGTIGTGFNNHFIHGWQMIGYHDRDTEKYSVDALYLAGYRFNSEISNFNMIGMRRDDMERDGHFVGLFNTTWFYDYSQDLTFGIEMNNEFREKSDWIYLLMPQIHWDITNHATLQFGVGLSQANRKETNWLGSWRMIYAF